MTTRTGNEHLPHKHNKSQTTAVYQLTKVKLHLQKKTIAMNIKSRIGKGETLRGGGRERVMEGTSERTTVEKIYNYHTYIYTLKTPSKDFFIYIIYIYNI